MFAPLDPFNAPLHVGADCAYVDRFAYGHVLDDDARSVPIVATTPDATPFHSTFAAGAGGAAWLLCFGFMGVRRRLARSRKRDAARGMWQRSTCEVRRISLGFDWSARAALQRQLLAAERELDLTTADGMYAAAQQTAALLQGALPAAQYASWESARHLPAHAQGALDHLDTRLRGRFSELLTGDANGLKTSGAKAHAEEGRGFVVVSVRARRPSTPRRRTVNISSRPSRRDAAASGWSRPSSAAAVAERISSTEIA